MCLKNFKFFAAVFIITLAAPSVRAAEVEVSGECMGVKLYTNGLIVCDTAALTELDGTTRDIAAEYGIEKGDVITNANGVRLSNTEDITSILAENENEITLTVANGDDQRQIKVDPADTADGQRLGLWLRDSTAGFGTLTCYYGGRFAALGHGICDIDTGNIMPVANGIIQRGTITSVTKSKNGSPGAITGDIDGEVIGTVTDNCKNGLFGEYVAEHRGITMDTAKKSDIKRGYASILADVDGMGVKEYDIEIKKIFADSHGRDMVIRITDNDLIEKTGGIVQGMSGAPIIQNGRLAGAVTHVFVNDARSGYAIFAENLLKGIL